MSKFRKLPVVIDAVQWIGDNVQEISELGNGFCLNQDLTLTIYTLEGNHTANLDDYIIRGVKGELYPCKPDIFEATYGEDSLNDKP